MLESTNLLLLVGLTEHNEFSPKKITIWNTSKNIPVCSSLEFKGNITTAKINKKRIVVSERNYLYIYSLEEMKILHTIYSGSINLGKIVLSPNIENNYLCYSSVQDEGIVKREDIFVTSKIYASTNHSKAIEKSLNNLDIGYIDLLLIHQPGFDDKGLYQTMEKYYKDGELKAIGISNYYTKEAIDEVLSYAEIVPTVIQNENHIYYQNNELQEYVKQYGIIIESWYPFGGRGHTDENFNNETIVKIAKKYNKTSAQIILRWQLQAGYIAIPGSKNPDHIKENISIFDFELSDEDMKEIYNINENRRYENW